MHACMCGSRHKEQSTYRLITHLGTAVHFLHPCTHVCMSLSMNVYVQETGVGRVSAVTCALDGSMSQQAVLSLRPFVAAPSGANMPMRRSLSTVFTCCAHVWINVCIYSYCRRNLYIQGKCVRAHIFQHYLCAHVNASSTSCACLLRKSAKCHLRWRLHALMYMNIHILSSDETKQRKLLTALKLASSWQRSIEYATFLFEIAAHEISAGSISEVWNACERLWTCVDGNYSSAWDFCHLPTWPQSALNISI